MAEGKTQLFWKMDCLMCNTTLTLEAIGLTIVDPTDANTRFIQKPKFICEKCKSACHMELFEKEVQGKPNEAECAKK